MLHTRDLESLGQQVFETIFLYFNLKIKPIFTKTFTVDFYAEIMEKIMYIYKKQEFRTILFLKNVLQRTEHM